MGVNVWARVTIELSAHCTAAAHDDFRIRFLNSSVVLRRVFSIIFMTLRSVFGEGGKKRHGVGPAISARRKPQTKDNNTGKSRHSRLPIFVCHGPPSIFRKRPAVFSDFRSTVTTPSPHTTVRFGCTGPVQRICSTSPSSRVGFVSRESFQIRFASMTSSKLKFEQKKKTKKPNKTRSDDGRAAVENATSKTRDGNRQRGRRRYERANTSLRVVEEKTARGKSAKSYDAPRSLRDGYAKRPRSYFTRGHRFGRT